jgi:hypothetical protein
MAHGSCDDAGHILTGKKLRTGRTVASAGVNRRVANEKRGRGARHILV